MVLTIIILLLLAGISISMISGQDGILNKATKAKENTNNSTEIENIELSIITSVMQEGIDKISEAEMQDILKDYTVSKVSTDVFKVTNNNEKVYYINSNGKIIEQEKITTLENLQIGDIVEYYTKEGKYIPESDKTGIIEEQSFETINGKIKCIVLDRDESGNIRIIPMNSVGKVTFAGYYGWNGAEGILNNIATLYHNEDYSIGSVSAGANEKYEADTEALKNIYNMGFVNIVSESRGATSGSGQKIVSKEADNYWNESVSAWLASKIYDSTNDNFNIRFYNAVDNSFSVSRVYNGTWLTIHLRQKGFIPVITLKNDIQVYGEGTEANPYNFIPAN